MPSLGPVVGASLFLFGLGLRLQVRLFIKAYLLALPCRDLHKAMTLRLPSLPEWGIALQAQSGTVQGPSAKKRKTPEQSSLLAAVFSGEGL